MYKKTKCLFPLKPDRNNFAMCTFWNGNDNSDFLAIFLNTTRGNIIRTNFELKNISKIKTFLNEHKNLVSVYVMQKERCYHAGGYKNLLKRLYDEPPTFVGIFRICFLTKDGDVYQAIITQNKVDSKFVCKVGFVEKIPYLKNIVNCAYTTSAITTSALFLDKNGKIWEEKEFYELPKRQPKFEEKIIKLVQSSFSYGLIITEGNKIYTYGAGEKCHEYLKYKDVTSLSKQQINYNSFDYVLLLTVDIALRPNGKLVHLYNDNIIKYGGWTADASCAFRNDMSGNYTIKHIGKDCVQHQNPTLFYCITENNHLFLCSSENRDNCEQIELHLPHKCVKIACTGYFTSYCYLILQYQDGKMELRIFNKGEIKRSCSLNFKIKNRMERIQNLKERHNFILDLKNPTSFF